MTSTLLIRFCRSLLVVNGLDATSTVFNVQGLVRTDVLAMRSISAAAFR